MAERRGACTDLVEKWEGKRPLGRPGRRWEDNTIMNVQERELGCGLIWLRLGTSDKLL
jgi:hypothetical protein